MDDDHTDAAEETPRVEEATIGFLDLVRFTSLTDVHGDAAAVDLVTRFVATIQSSLVASSELVKTLGDGALLRAERPDDLLTSYLRAIGAWRKQEFAPSISAGMHHGPVTGVDGDVFGATVNVASRLESIATAGQLAMTRPIAQVASSIGITVRPLGSRLLRGVVEPVDVFVTPDDTEPSEVVDDPVCGMRIAPGPETPSRVHESRSYYFCSEACDRIFARSPQRYA